jgi:hypothetical protein
VSIRLPMPMLGANTRDLLGELGYQNGEIESLAAQGVI